MLLVMLVTSKMSAARSIYVKYISSNTEHLKQNPLNYTFTRNTVFFICYQKEWYIPMLEVVACASGTFQLAPFATCLKRVYI